MRRGRFFCTPNLVSFINSFITFNEGTKKNSTSFRDHV